MAPRIPEEIDVFTRPHTRMKELVKNFTEKMHHADLSNMRSLLSLLSDLHSTLLEFRRHEAIENVLILDRLKQRIQQHHKLPPPHLGICHDGDALPKLFEFVRWSEGELSGQESGHACNEGNSCAQVGGQLPSAYENFLQHFLPHMKQEEQEFQPLLMNHFEYNELKALKDEVWLQHQLYSEQQRQKQFVYVNSNSDKTSLLTNVISPTVASSLHSQTISAAVDSSPLSAASVLNPGKMKDQRCKQKMSLDPAVSSIENGKGPVSVEKSNAFKNCSSFLGSGDVKRNANIKPNETLSSTGSHYEMKLGDVACNLKAFSLCSDLHDSSFVNSEPSTTPSVLTCSSFKSNNILTSVAGNNRTVNISEPCINLNRQITSGVVGAQSCHFAVSTSSHSDTALNMFDQQQRQFQGVVYDGTLMNFQTYKAMKKGNVFQTVPIPDMEGHDCHLLKDNKDYYNERHSYKNGIITKNLVSTKSLLAESIGCTQAENLHGIYSPVSTSSDLLSTSSSHDGVFFLNNNNVTGELYLNATIKEKSDFYVTESNNLGMTVTRVSTSLILLHYEVLLEIMRYLSPRDLLHLASVSKTLNTVAYDTTLWRELYPTQWTIGLWTWHDLQLGENSPFPAFLGSLLDEDADYDTSDPAPLTVHHKRILEGLATGVCRRAGAGVKVLVLDGAGAVCSRTLRRVLALCPNLDTLRAAYTSVDSTTFKGLCERGALRQLRVLDLRGCCYMDDPALTMFASCAVSRWKNRVNGRERISQDSHRWLRAANVDGNSNNVGCKMTVHQQRKFGAYRSQHKNSCNCLRCNYGTSVADPVCESSSVCSVRRTNLSHSTSTCSSIKCVQKFNSKLQTLNLSGCYKITDSGLNHLIKSGFLHCLRQIDLSGLHMLTEASITHLLNSCADLHPNQLSYCDNVVGVAEETEAGGCDNLGHPLLYCCRRGD